jgi:hypothetical protein
MNSYYSDKISAFAEADLAAEEENLKVLIRKVSREYNDRADTLLLLMNQLQQVRNLRAKRNETQVAESFTSDPRVDGKDKMVH